jgi:hypothetical protein
MMRKSNLYKVTSIILVVFSMSFVIMVYYSLKTEDIQQINIKNKEDTNIECGDSLFFNLSFAIILAALWNGKKIIKIGVI